MLRGMISADPFGPAPEDRVSEGTMTPAVIGRFITQLEDAFRDGDPLSAEKEAEAANLTLLREQYEAIGAGNFGKALQILADDIEMEIVCPPDFSFAGRWKGRADVTEAIGRNFAQVADQRPEVEQVIAQGDTVVIVGRETGKYLPTGRWYALNWVHLHQFKDGQVIRFREIVGHATFSAEPPG